MVRLLRVHGGYQGWPDERLLNDIPYARFSQEARLAAEALAEEERGRMRAAAFAGWHALVAFQGSDKVGGPQEYLERAGLTGRARRESREDPEARRMKREADLQRAHDNAKRVREAFSRGGRRTQSPTGTDAAP